MHKTDDYGLKRDPDEIPGKRKLWVSSSACSLHYDIMSGALLPPVDWGVG